MALLRCLGEESGSAFAVPHERLAQAPENLELEQVAAAADGLSGAELRRLCEDARRSAILDGFEAVQEVDLLRRFVRSRVPGLDKMTMGDRLAAARKVSSRLFTVRRLSEMFAVSTGKVSTLLREETDS